MLINHVLLYSSRRVAEGGYDREEPDRRLRALPSSGEGSCQEVHQEHYTRKRLTLNARKMIIISVEMA